MKYFLLAGVISTCSLVARSYVAAPSIEGHVLNSLTGAPLRKAYVELTGPAVYFADETDAEGKFQFIGLPSGPYRLTASRSGFLDRAIRRPILLSANDEITDVEVRLPPQGVIAGRVFDEDGEPVDRARLRVLKWRYVKGSGRWDELRVCQSNDAGEYRFADLKPGRYLVSAHHSRVFNKALYVPIYYPNAPSQEQAMPILLATGSDVLGIDFRLFKVSRPPAVRIRGKVTGLPMDSQMEVSVHLKAAEGLFGGGDDVAKPPDYTFDFTTAAGQYMMYGSVLSGGPPAYANAVLTVTGDVAGVALAMYPAPEVTGRITIADSGNQVNLQGIRVALDDLPLHLGGQQAQPDAAGKLAFAKPVRPGHYAMTVQGIPEAFFVRSVKFEDKEISSDDFEIVSSLPLEIILSSAAGRIAGSVLDAGGKPYPGSTVTLIPPDQKSRPVRQDTDDDGNFEFSGVRPGNYKLFAWEEVDDDLWQDPEFRKAYETQGTEITVGKGESTHTKLRVITVDSMK